MSDVTQAIDRIGERIASSPPGLPELERRRRRATGRRRARAATLAVVVAIGGSALAARAVLVAPRDSSEPSVVTPGGDPSASATISGTTCPVPSGDSPPAVVLASTSGPAGSTVRVSGSFQTGMAWLQLWWNADDTGAKWVDPPPWQETGPDLGRALDPNGAGPMWELTAIAGPASTGDCSFQASFTVPDVGPGRYQILAVFGDARAIGDDAFALMSSRLTFDVSA